MPSDYLQWTDRVIDMKTTLMILVCGAALFVSGCTAGIKRIGYELPKEQRARVKNAQRCPIAIQCAAKHDPADVEVLGRIKAYETGFSWECDEAYVLDIFCNEACSLGADLVVVTEEKQPDFGSTCYRAKAEFVRFRDRAKAEGLLSDAKYAPELIIERAERSKKRARDIIAASVMSGVLGGIIASSVK